MIRSMIWMTVVFRKYRQPSDIRRTLVSIKTADDSYEVGASPVGAAPTASSFLTLDLDSVDWAKTTARRDDNHLRFGI